MEVEKIELSTLEGRSKELYNEFSRCVIQDHCKMHEGLILSINSRVYGSPPEVVIRVPGRVNIIGEHIDYCGYAVHPMAIDQDMLVAVRRNEEGGLVLRNMDKR